MITRAGHESDLFTVGTEVLGMLLLVEYQIVFLQHGHVIDLRFSISRVDVFQTSHYNRMEVTCSNWNGD